MALAQPRVRLNVGLEEANWGSFAPGRLQVYTQQIQQLIVARKVLGKTSAELK